MLNKDNREQEEWENFVRRKAARKARNSAVAINSTALSPCISTPDSFEMPVSEDGEHAVPPFSQHDPSDNMGPSSAGGPIANHNTPSPPSSPLTTAVDPALLNVAVPKNSMLTQAQNVVPAPPNPYTSGPKRELSPLGNPPGEETTTETVGAPSSCSRKRKSAKNNTGKGKAPPKQRRKTAEGSQSRSARI